MKKLTLIAAALLAATGAMAQTSGAASPGNAGTTGVVTGSTSANTTTGIAPADGSNIAATPTPGATVQSSSGAVVNSGTGVMVTPGVSASTTTVLGGPGATTTRTTTTRTWTGLTMYPPDMERDAAFQRHMALK